MLTDSLREAKVFEKAHRGVLRDIDNLTAQSCAVNSMFREETFINEKGRSMGKYDIIKEAQQQKKERKYNRLGSITDIMYSTDEWRKVYVDAQSANASELRYPFKLCLTCLDVIFISDGTLLACPVCRNEPNIEKVKMAKLVKAVGINE